MTIVITALPAMNPVPGVSVSFAAADIPAGTTKVTVWREADGRTFKVRGGVDRAFSASLGLLDLEAPFDTESAYELECWNGATFLSRILLGSVTLPWTGGDNELLIQQPLDPHLCLVVENLDGSWPAITRDSAGERVLTEGAHYPVLIGFGPRQAAKSVDLDVAVTSRAEAATLWATLGTEERPQLPVWLIRPHYGLLPRVFFCHVQTVAEVDIDTAMGNEWSRFKSTVDQIAPPAPALIVSPLSYTDLDVTYASYTTMDSAFASYNARDTAWNLAGASG